MPGGDVPGGEGGQHPPGPPAPLTAGPARIARDQRTPFMRLSRPTEPQGRPSCAAIAHAADRRRGAARSAARGADADPARPGRVALPRRRPGRAAAGGAAA